jgi:CBS domain-containing protein
MTANPSCCLPGDSASVAARLMKQEDVGPVLVIASHADKRLVGIVTDRDLALKVVAEGRDGNTTRVDEVMSPNPVTCSEDDDATEAIRRMSQHQVRRIPVLDAQGRLSGIIAQADVALHADEEEVGEMVEDISQPFGSGEWTGRGLAGMRSAASSMAVGAICLGVGAAMMYLLDPTRGSDRRQALASRTSGVVEATRTKLRSRRGSDATTPWQGEQTASRNRPW